MENQLVYEFRKNATEKVKVELLNYRGTEVINIRVFYKNDAAKGEWRPTQRGITMRVDRITELKKAIDKAYAEWEKKEA